MKLHKDEWERIAAAYQQMSDGKETKKKQRDDLRRCAADIRAAVAALPGNRTNLYIDLSRVGK